MSQIQDLIERFLSFPKDFAYSELTRLLSHFKYREIPGGKGSHFRFQRHPGEQVIITQSLMEEARPSIGCT